MDDLERWRDEFPILSRSVYMISNSLGAMPKQTARNLPSVAAANTDFPNLLPSVSYDGSGPSISWNDISPRVSATFALDAARKTITRASFARYAGQLNPGQVTLASPVGSYYSYIAYKWNDLNGDHLAQKNEVLTNLAPLYWGSGIDIRNPGSAQPPPRAGGTAGCGPP